MPTATIITTTLTAPADGAVTADDIARTATILAFPPIAADVAAVAADIGRMPIAKLLPTSRNMLELVELRGGDPASSTADLHAVFGAMLALCRVLDDAGYPWDAAARGARA